AVLNHHPLFLLSEILTEGSSCCFEYSLRSLRCPPSLAPQEPFGTGRSKTSEKNIVVLSITLATAASLNLMPRVNSLTAPSSFSKTTSYV
ncbi:hypothetical protein M433DRAFT_550965, partial [Acidomyces richmondensis BFW]